MSEKPTNLYYPVTDFRNLNSPIVDVRSPLEYSQGHWPGAINIPLFSDSERESIGKSYKKESRLKAIFNGLKLIIPNIKNLLHKILEITNKENGEKKSLRIYCWRGGMRSSSFAWLARTVGIQTYLLKGGYKSYRKWVLNQFEADLPIRLLGGKTGTRKTDLLKHINIEYIYVIDLEGIANHRGSSFGSLGMEKQPSSQQFENLLAECLENFYKSNATEIWIEAESCNLGKCRIPNSLYIKMKKAPILEIIRTTSERIDNLVNVYSKNSQSELKDAVNRIRKRLGPQRTNDALMAIENKDWSKACEAMLDYYDRCYEYELKKTTNINSIDLSGLSLKSSLIKIFNERLNPL
ncbi:tRNA 2-selenouridine(34) synthase MnmH [Prochlorococcus marinus]|uniref:tRNA 2-selenouridine(34) synthase MnmH n=1 Tax=Prochlorococcus marinus XMU1408 TaxID=2213228 RepID=A0A318RAA3_PROMR|nr:tRNA 2-selenouridine(34) synthase MnmH [Prochlorococcus marinus]MBW3041733.1 tRNA 2-selenouridine(34) synthase MnmH [Prochlorococcus marinus str. XMU1408]PYE02879.1 tRNA 2-selenouridine(34) synthase MnmH [Prochlorococcus marinus XMU1408]